MVQPLDFKNIKNRRVFELKITKLLANFESVSDEIEIRDVRAVKVNNCYREYILAIKIAKMILRRYDYAIDNVSNKAGSVPPFWIDMSRLFEVYVYSLLKRAYPNQIGFQVEGFEVSGKATAVDFIKLDEKLIMDAKYKYRYVGQKENPDKEMLDDVREVSAYARDRKILGQLGVLDSDTEEI